MRSLLAALTTVTFLPAVRSLQITISGSDPERSVDLAQAEVALLGQLPARSSQKTHVKVQRIREPYPRPAVSPSVISLAPVPSAAPPASAGDSRYTCGWTDVSCSTSPWLESALSVMSVSG